jgi:hypothetical protein
MKLKLPETLENTEWKGSWKAENFPVNCNMTVRFSKTTFMWELSVYDERKNSYLTNGIVREDVPYSVMRFIPYSYVDNQLIMYDNIIPLDRDNNEMTMTKQTLFGSSNIAFDVFMPVDKEIIFNLSAVDIDTNLFVLPDDHLTALEKAIKNIDIDFFPSSDFIVSQNKNPIYVAPVSQSNPVPKISLSQPHALKDTVTFNVLFGMVHSIIRHKDGDFLCFVYVSPSYCRECTWQSDSAKMLQQPWAIIEKHLCYGERFNGTDVSERPAKLQYYPPEQSLKMFNADCMISYPIEMEGMIYEDKYTVCQGTVLISKYRNIYIYTMMTNESASHFEEHLNSLGKMFRFK